MGITNWDISQSNGVDRFMFGQSQLTSSLPTSPAKPTTAAFTCTTNSYSDQNYQNQFGFLENTMNYPANHRRHSVAVQPRSLSQSLGDKNLPILIPHSRNMIFQQHQNRLDLSMFENDLGFDETEDFSASDVDSISTSNSSPLVHRKVERSRSEPKAPAELINRVHHKSGGSSNSATTGSQQNMGDKRYKTEMCRSFLEGRECTYKEKCRYAHGNYEIRSVTRHPKYRTEYCRPFHATGICSYGHRCNFIHNPDEVMQRRISVSESKSVSPRLSPTGNSLGSAGILMGNNNSNHGRPRAISLSAAPVENFIGEQKREMGGIGDSLSTLNSSGFASYPSSPMSMSPGVDGMGSWFAHFNSNDVFGSNIDDLGSVTEEVGEQGAWVEALNVLLAGL